MTKQLSIEDQLAEAVRIRIKVQHVTIRRTDTLHLDLQPAGADYRYIEPVVKRWCAKHRYETMDDRMVRDLCQEIERAEVEVHCAAIGYGSPWV